MNKKNKYSVANIKKISGYTITTIERAYKFALAHDKSQGYIKNGENINFGDRRSKYWREFVDIVIEDPNIIEWFATGIVKEYDRNVIKIPHKSSKTRKKVKRQLLTGFFDDRY
ncbi:MAG: hypothetical protein M0P71_07255 [Melioribacteraceae bacterium]|jgi:hypothetical protein|nr:hypothetical protein [Melioribacteraceae bacterium]MDD3982849.1 hypothetical protein [Candidatus Omnitrophota bacterium]